MYSAPLGINQVANSLPPPPPGPVSGGHGVVLDRQEDVRRPVWAPLPPSMAIMSPLGPRYAA
jgi:hypothetical protein